MVIHVCRLFVCSLGAALAEGSPRHCRHTSTPSNTYTPSHTTKWHVDASRHVDEGDEQSMTPLLPRMVELDLLKHRQTDTLLGESRPIIQLSINDK